MTPGQWSLDDAVTDGFAIIDEPGLRALKEAAPRRDGDVRGGVLYDDATLLDIINSELRGSIVTAFSVDRYDRDAYEQQERFKGAYAAFTAAIASLDDPLRNEVSLPQDYVLRIDDSWLLHYAVPRDGGRPVEWKKDEFYFRLLVIYQVVMGQKPASTEAGPTMRFMRAIVAILRTSLDSATESSTKGYDLVNALWRLPSSQNFLKEWFRSKGGAAQIHRRIEAVIAQSVRHLPR